VTGFAFPLLLPLAVLAPLAFVWLVITRRRNLRIPGLFVRRQRGTGLGVATALALAGLAVAWLGAAGPRVAALRGAHALGRDVVVLLDLSASMGAPSGRDDTLAAARKAVERLAAVRRTDRLAVVAFGSKAVVLAPLTLDHATLLALTGSLTPATFGSETAIGDALAVGLQLLRGTPRGSGGMVLVSDGENNAGAVDPITVAEVAKDRGIPVSTVGVGPDSDSDTPSPINVPLMREIARRTGGEFVRARDDNGLTAAFEHLAKLEPTTVPAPARWVWTDRSGTPACLAAALFLAATLVEAASRRVWT
jgi:Ca-activated chloride channel family protein